MRYQVQYLGLVRLAIISPLTNIAEADGEPIP